MARVKGFLTIFKNYINGQCQDYKANKSSPKKYTSLIWKKNQTIFMIWLRLYFLPQADGQANMFTGLGWWAI